MPCANQQTSHRLLKLNIGTPTFMRAPGEASGSFALECALDELADKLGMDPVALRLRNHADADPGKWTAVLEQVAARMLPGRRRALRLGPAQSGTALHARRWPARGHGHGHYDLPGQPLERECHGAHPA
ncbi:molybdopterin cofactor-binding domain-containing protein [Cupriavidus basilensis]